MNLLYKRRPSSPPQKNQTKNESIMKNKQLKRRRRKRREKNQLRRLSPSIVTHGKEWARNVVQNLVPGIIKLRI